MSDEYRDFGAAVRVHCRDGVIRTATICRVLVSHRGESVYEVDFGTPADPAEPRGVRRLSWDDRVERIP